MASPKKTDTKKSADQITLDLIKEVKTRKAEIAKAERHTWLTNGSFNFIPGGGTINLHVADTGTLMQIATYLYAMSSSYDAVVRDFGVEKAPAPKWGGYTISDWLTDVQARVTKIQIQSKKDKLEVLEARLNSILTPEMRAHLELQAIQEELGS
jgi:hypothetical protein